MIAWESERQVRQQPSSGPNHAAQLLALRDFVSKYGFLHEAQAQQLKIWPRVAFPNSTPATRTEVDLNGNFVVVKIVSDKKHNKVKTRAIMLTKNIQWMLGPIWSVSIFENDKLLLKKAGQAPKENKIRFPKTKWKLQPQTKRSRK